MRAGNIDYEVQRARREAERIYHQPLSATANAILLVGCAVGLVLIVAGVKLAKAWGLLS